MQIRVFGSSEIIISILRGKSYWVYINAYTAYVCLHECILMYEYTHIPL